MGFARVAVVALALVVCAWFALGIRQAHETSAAGTIVNGSRVPSAVAASHARSLLREAATLNPDSQVDLLRATLALRESDLSTAARLARSVTRREPMNVQAWLLLAEAAPNNASVVDAAVGRMAQLDPILGRSR